MKLYRATRRIVPRSLDLRGGQMIAGTFLAMMFGSLIALMFVGDDVL